MRLLVAIVCGGLFGAGLYISGMTQTDKVLGFLDIFGNWDPTLGFVMGGALLPMTIAWRYASGATPMLGGQFPAPNTDGVTSALVIGAFLFGMGWGLVGLCPGPAVASLSYGGFEGVVFLLAMLAGMTIAPLASRWLDSLRRLA